MKKENAHNAPLNIADALDEIEATILKRGKDYWRRGAVTRLELLEEGRYEAVVMGSERYELELEFEDGDLVWSTCDCPYAQDGDTCKHIAAVLLKLQADEGAPMYRDQPIEPTTQAPNLGKKRKPTVAERIDAVLDRMTADEIKEWLRKQCIADADFRERLFRQHEHRVRNLEHADYVAQIESILVNCEGRDGFIGYHESGAVADQVGELLDTAQSMLASKQYADAWAIATAVAQEMSKALSYADDSNGEMSGCMEAAFAIMDEMAGMASLPNDLRLEARAYCMEAYGQSANRGWDSEINLLQLAGEFSRTPQEAGEVIALGSEPLLKEYSPDYRLKVVAAMVLQFQGAEAELEFLQTHIAVKDFRKRLIDNALMAKDWIRAMTLAEEGYAQDRDDKPGYAQSWLDILLEIAQKTQDKSKVIKLARQLFESSYHEPFKYYDHLKAQFGKREWKAYVADLLLHLKKTKHQPAHIFAGIYEREGELELLKNLVFAQGSKDWLDRYEKILAPKYNAEFVQAWLNLAKGAFNYASSRNAYQNACGLLMRVTKLGAHERALQLANEIRLANKKRPALLDELKQAGY